MKCDNCGNEFDGVFCDKCDTSNQEIESRFVQKVKESFIESEEVLVDILGTNTAKTFFSTGLLGNGFAILSDKRMYFKGRCYIRVGKGFLKKMEERVVDLNDITGTGFVHNKNVIFSWLFKICVVLFGISTMIPLVFWIIYLSNNKKWAFTIALILSGPLTWLFYFLDKIYNYSLFEVSYAGGGIAFELSWITKEDSDNFQKSLQKTKSNYKKRNQQEYKYMHKEKSIPDLLKEYKELLDSGIISQEEFDTKKKELLTK